MCGILGISMWVYEPRDFIKDDEILMALHPFTCSMFTTIFFIMWALAIKFGIKVFKFFDELDKQIRSKTGKDGKSNNV